MDKHTALKLIHEVRLHILGVILRNIPNAELSNEMRDKCRRIEVKLTARKSTRAGTWRRQIWRTRTLFGQTELSFVEFITINTALCNTEERFRSTLLHEFSHACLHWQGKREFDDHGPLWKQWQVWVGADPNDVRHNYDMDAAFAAKGGYYKHVGCNRGHVIKVTPSKAALIRKHTYVCVSCARDGVHKNPVRLLDQQIEKSTK